MKYISTVKRLAATTALLAGGLTAAFAAGPPAADSAAATAIIGPAGGSISHFGVTATFAPGAITDPNGKLIVLGTWPNGLDVPPPNGETAVKTFGLQQCALDGTNCTSPFGNFPNAPAAATQQISGLTLGYTAFQPNVAYGSATNKLVTITVETNGTNVYIYNPNFATTAEAYPKRLPSTSDGTTLTFQTFQPIVWTITTPATASSTTP
ncbi:MAG: hypothetical protein NVS4B8_30250 [Herpetosiphon sp.]